jgi:DNA-binding NarL/FixJ family response regulator
MDLDMGNFAEVNVLSIAQEQVQIVKKKLAGKIIQVVGPRKLENDLLVSFIRQETDAECFASDFDEIEGFIGSATQEPSRLFLIDYREPRLREILEQASFNGTCSFLARRLIALFDSGKSKDTADRIRREIACGILYGCDSATVLLNRICRLFGEGGTSENGLTECEEASGETTSPLTWRELQLLMLMTEGLQNREIASRIGISTHTVRTHLYNSFNKINARNRLEANAWIEAHISMLYLLI